MCVVVSSKSKANIVIYIAPMGKCCICRQTPRTQRRINGLQLPLNFLQVMGWIVFITTALMNFTILIEIQFHELKVVSIITFVILYVCHVSSHVTAALTDPSERELRNLKVNNVPEFDRSVHAHVIENGRCHLCNIYTSSKNTKHCSLCNKCVDHFDHHCKWLNNCVGQRNYAAFITCVTTALLISFLTTTLCLTDIVLFLAHPSRLNYAAQNFINCTTGPPSSNYIKYCRNSITFLTFLVIFGMSALAITCALLHLCCFHVYISILGISTYEYIVKGKPRKNIRCKCCMLNISRNYQAHGKNTESSNNYEAEVEDANDNKMNSDAAYDSRENEERNVTGLITMLIANELVRAKKIFLYDKNKIHPEEQTEDSNS